MMIKKDDLIRLKQKCLQFHFDRLQMYLNENATAKAMYSTAILASSESKGDKKTKFRIMENENEEKEPESTDK